MEVVILLLGLICRLLVLLVLLWVMILGRHVSSVIHAWCTLHI